MLLEIVDWDRLYENSRSRAIDKLSWVATPNRHDGAGYAEIVQEHPEGAAHIGAWCMLVQVFSQKQRPRGTLEVPSDGTVASLGRHFELKTRIPSRIWTDALPRFSKVGWLKGLPSERHSDVTPAAEGDAVVRRTEGRREGTDGKERTPSTSGLVPEKGPEGQGQEPLVPAPKPPGAKTGKTGTVEPEMASGSPQEVARHQKTPETRKRQDGQQDVTGGASGDGPTPESRPLEPEQDLPAGRLLVDACREAGVTIGTAAKYVLDGYAGEWILAWLRVTRADCMSRAGTEKQIRNPEAWFVKLVRSKACPPEAYLTQACRDMGEAKRQQAGGCLDDSLLKEWLREHAVQVRGEGMNAKRNRALNSLEGKT